MLTSDLEIRKGILFIRLKGDLTEKTVNNITPITTLISENGLSNVVLNIEDLKYIDKKGISIFLYIYELCKKNNGKSLLCGVNKNIDKKIKNSRIENYIPITNNELKAFEIIKV